MSYELLNVEMSLFLQSIHTLVFNRLEREPTAIIEEQLTKYYRYNVEQESYVLKFRKIHTALQSKNILEMKKQ